jgi:hypothetical protein
MVASAVWVFVSVATVPVRITGSKRMSFLAWQPIGGTFGIPPTNALAMAHPKSLIPKGVSYRTKHYFL